MTNAIDPAPLDDQAKALKAEATVLLQELLRVDTSNPPGGETAAARILTRYLTDNGVECELVAHDPERANLVARVPGTRPGAPSLMLLGHTDVVPADPSAWTHPPFAGTVDDDGWLWGRGALDMKNEVATRAVALAVIARSGEQLDGDLFLVAVSDEEDGTNDLGASWLVKQRPELATSYVINEGASGRLELADGRTIIEICVGEKATVRVSVTAIGRPGHASTPDGDDRAVPILGELIGRLSSYKPRRRLIPETERMLQRLVGYRPGDDVDRAIAEAAGLHPALARSVPAACATTIAPTRLFGSSATNVLPARASVHCDCRLVPGTSEADLLDELREALGTDLPYELEVIEPLTGGTVSTVDSPLFDACAEFFARQDPGATLVPDISTGFTDSHYVRQEFGSVAYGIWPSRYTPHEVQETVHGNDERVNTDDLGYTALFHVEVCRALLNSASDTQSEADSLA